jgi:acyl carrier protein
MLEKITQILREYKSDDALEVTESSTFEDIGLDSLDMVELVMELEDQLGVKIEMDNTIKDIKALIQIVENAPKQ